MKEATLDEVASSIASNHTIEMLLRNLGFIRPDGQMTVASILLFAKYTQRWLPVMTAKCISFVGNSVGSKTYRDQVKSELMEGNLMHQFEVIMSFLTRNLRNIQVQNNFNTPGQLEIPYESLLEFVVNALVHRSLNWSAPIRIFIFDNRVEIHSPGNLPNGLEVNDIVLGTSLPRNRFLFDNAIHLLPYTGAGSGMQRALNSNITVDIKNDERLHEFLITIQRNGADSGATNTSDSETTNTSDSDKDSRPRLKLTKKQKDIVNFCSIPRTSREILERMGVTYHSKNINVIIKPLLELGVLEMTNPENPNASNQKYRRTK